MGAAGLWSTATDLAKFVNEIMLSWKGQSNKVISLEMTTEMLSTHADDVPDMNPLDLTYGLGWYLWEFGKYTYFVHGGDNPEGFQCIVIGLPENGWGVVIMTNGVNGDRLYFEILYSIAEVYGFLPPLRTLAVFGYVISLLFLLLILWLVAYLMLWIWSKKSVRELESQKRRIVSRYLPVFLFLIPLTIIISAVVYYITLEIITDIAANPSLETHQSLKALGMIERGNLFTQHGMMEEALMAYEEAENIEPDLNIYAEDWNKLCWYGSLWGDAGDALVACDRAVELAPEDALIKDSRGLARALSGDYAGAIEDFTEYVEWLQKNRGDEYEINLRQIWISELEAGQNPFDEEMLLELR
jgi:hypothetical protein